VVAEPLPALLARLGVGPTEWDWLLVGDGSGSTWDRACGWACAVIERLADPDTPPAVFSGSCDRGTNIFAEVMAFLAPLQWVQEQEKERRKRLNLAPRPVRVHLLTDNQYCSEEMARRDRLRKGGQPSPEGKYGELWCVYEHLGRRGYSLRWHLVGRETVGLHVGADRLSRACRKHNEDGGPGWPAVRLPGSELRGIENFNPAR
jgi:ribonuclease HI